MANRRQSYDVVFNLIAKGGDQAKRRITEIAKLASQVGNDKLTDSMTSGLNNIQGIYDGIVHRTIDAKKATQLLQREYANMRKAMENADIFGAKQAEEAKKEIEELTKAQKNYNSAINAIETAPSKLYDRGSLQLRTGSHNGKMMWGTKAKAAKGGSQDPAKDSIEGILGTAFGEGDFKDAFSNTNFTRLSHLKKLYDELTPSMQSFDRVQQDAYKRLGVYLENLDKEVQRRKEQKDILKEQKEANQGEIDSSRYVTISRQ